MSGAGAARARPESYARGLVLVAAAGLFWSLGGLFFRMIDEAGVWRIVAWRTFFLATSMALLLCWRYRSETVAVFRGMGRWGLVAAVATAVANTLFMWSLEYTYVANTVLMLAAAPVLAAILGRVLLGERVRPATTVAMAGVCVGVAVMVSGGLGADRWIGDVLAVFMVLAFAVIVVAVRAGRDVEMLPCVVLGGSLACVFAAAMALLGGAGLAMTGGDLVWCAAMGVIQMTGGMALFVAGARHVPAGELALLSLTEVIFGPIWVWLLLDEIPVEATFWGGGIVFAAIAFNAVTGVRRKRPPPPA